VIVDNRPVNRSKLDIYKQENRPSRTELFKQNPHPDAFCGDPKISSPPSFLSTALLAEQINSLYAQV
jgi:hypothetical protein